MQTGQHNTRLEGGCGALGALAYRTATHSSTEQANRLIILPFVVVVLVLTAKFYTDYVLSFSQVVC